MTYRMNRTSRTSRRLVALLGALNFKGYARPVCGRASSSPHFYSYLESHSHRWSLTGLSNSQSCKCLILGCPVFLDEETAKRILGIQWNSDPMSISIMLYRKPGSYLSTTSLFSKFFRPPTIPVTLHPWA